MGQAPVSIRCPPFRGDLKLRGLRAVSRLPGHSQNSVLRQAGSALRHSLGKGRVWPPWPRCELAPFLILWLTCTFSAPSSPRAPFYPNHPVGLQSGHHTDVDGTSGPRQCPHPGLPD